MKITLSMIILVFSITSRAQTNTLPIQNIDPVIYTSIDSIVEKTGISQHDIRNAGQLSLFKETNEGFAFMFTDHETLSVYLLIPHSDFTHSIIETDAFDINEDGKYDIIVTVAHDRKWSTRDAMISKEVTSKIVLDTSNNQILLTDSILIKTKTEAFENGKNNVLLCLRPIHLFEGKIIFMPCTGRCTEVECFEKEIVYFWQDQSFMLKED